MVLDKANNMLKSPQYVNNVKENSFSKCCIFDTERAKIQSIDTKRATHWHWMGHFKEICSIELK